MLPRVADLIYEDCSDADYNRTLKSKRLMTNVSDPLSNNEKIMMEQRLLINEDLFDHYERRDSKNFSKEKEHDDFSEKQYHTLPHDNQYLVCNNTPRTQKTAISKVSDFRNRESSTNLQYYKQSPQSGSSSGKTSKSATSGGRKQTIAMIHSELYPDTLSTSDISELEKHYREYHDQLVDSYSKQKLSLAQQMCYMPLQNNRSDLVFRPSAQQNKFLKPEKPRRTSELGLKKIQQSIFSTKKEAIAPNNMSISNSQNDLTQLCPNTFALSLQRTPPCSLPNSPILSTKRSPIRASLKTAATASKNTPCLLTHNLTRPTLQDTPIPSLKNTQTPVSQNALLSFSQHNTIPCFQDTSLSCKHDISFQHLQNESAFRLQKTPGSCLEKDSDLYLSNHQLSASQKDSDLSEPKARLSFLCREEDICLQFDSRENNLTNPQQTGSRNFTSPSHMDVFSTNDHGMTSVHKNVLEEIQFVESLQNSVSYPRMLARSYQCKHLDSCRTRGVATDIPKKREQLKTEVVLQIMYAPYVPVNKPPSQRNNIEQSSSVLSSSRSDSDISSLSDTHWDKCHMFENDNQAFEHQKTTEFTNSINKALSDIDTPVLCTQQTQRSLGNNKAVKSVLDSNTHLKNLHDIDALVHSPQFKNELSHEISQSTVSHCASAFNKTPIRLNKYVESELGLATKQRNQHHNITGRKKNQIYFIEQSDQYNSLPPKQHSSFDEENICFNKNNSSQQRSSLTKYSKTSPRISKKNVMQSHADLTSCIMASTSESTQSTRCTKIEDENFDSVTQMEHDSAVFYKKSPQNCTHHKSPPKQIIYKISTHRVANVNVPASLVVHKQIQVGTPRKDYDTRSPLNTGLIDDSVSSDTCPNLVSRMEKNELNDHKHVNENELQQCPILSNESFFQESKISEAQLNKGFVSLRKPFRDHTFIDLFASTSQIMSPSNFTVKLKPGQNLVDASTSKTTLLPSSKYIQPVSSKLIYPDDNCEQSTVIQQHKCKFGRFRFIQLFSNLFNSQPVRRNFIFLMFLWFLFGIFLSFILCFVILLYFTSPFEPFLA